jgi:hypothetical protein
MNMLSVAWRYCLVPYIAVNPAYLGHINVDFVQSLRIYRVGALELPTLEPFYEASQSKNVLLPLVGGSQRPPTVVPLDSPGLRSEPFFAGTRFGEIQLRQSRGFASLRCRSMPVIATSIGRLSNLRLPVRASPRADWTKSCIRGASWSEYFRSLHDGDRVIADVTDHNPNVMYEIGYAHALKIFPLLIDATPAREEPSRGLPFYLKEHVVYRYGETESSGRNLGEMIQSWLASESVPGQ